MLRSYHCARVASLAALAGGLCVMRVHAHPAPAQPPQFGSTECIMVADKDHASTLHFQYINASDDTRLAQGDIALPDAKTHQFFAFSGLIRSFGPDRNLYPFAAGDPDHTTLPLWISRSDVQRAAAASDVSDATGFVEANVPQDGLLEANGALQGKWLRITADDARRPITVDQGLLGFDWDLSNVAPGVYTIAGYIFSPPFNGWEPRAGLVKLMNAASDPPALMLDASAGFLYSYQGRVITGCIDAPAGSTLRALVRIEERPEQGWRTFAEDVPAPTGRLQLCFTPAAGDRTGTALLRVDITTPDGSNLSAYSPDTLTLLQGNGTCVESDTVCCPASVPTQLPGAAGSSMSPVAAPCDTPQTVTPSSGSGCDASPRQPSPTSTWPLGLIILSMHRFLSMHRCHSRSRRPRSSSSEPPQHQRK